MLIDFRERGREGGSEGRSRGGEGARRKERRPSVAYHVCPDQGSHPKPRYAPSPGVRPATSGALDDARQTEPPNQAFLYLFKK